MDRPMMAPESTAPPGPGDAEVKTEESDTSSQSVTTLRGAGVDVDVRRAGRVVVGVCLAALAVLVIVLFLAGAHKNAQINLLRQHGVVVAVRVSGCTGLLGGSGSNPVGYACTGTFPFDGHRYDEAIPGNKLYPPGAKIRAVAAPGDPPLLSTVGAVHSEHSSWRVFILPTLLMVILALLVGALFLRRGHVRLRSAAKGRATLP
jgi:hypothetical protein